MSAMALFMPTLSVSWEGSADQAFVFILFLFCFGCWVLRHYPGFSLPEAGRGYSVAVAHGLLYLWPLLLQRGL